MSQFNWSALMQLGLHQLRLTPDQFWNLTPIELVIIASGTATANSSLTRKRLAELSVQFPDKTK